MITNHLPSPRGPRLLGAGLQIWQAPSVRHLVLTPGPRDKSSGRTRTITRLAFPLDSTFNLTRALVSTP